MATKKKEAEVKEETKNIDAEKVSLIDEVFDVSSIFEMKFLEPRTGEIVMVRRSYKPRGKLEFYKPEL